MKEELQKTLDILLEQKNSYLKEIKKPINLEEKNKIINYIFDIDEKIKYYLMK